MLYRSSRNKQIAGICGGIAECYDLNVTGLRILLLFVTIFLSGFPALLYLALWAILKER